MLFGTACWEPTDGNPLFVCELLAAAREEGFTARAESVSALHSIAPASVGTSVIARLGRMGADAVVPGRAVAVPSAGAEVVLGARLAELDRELAELTADGDTDGGLALTAEATIGCVGMANERTAPGAVRRAEGLRGRRRGRWLCEWTSATAPIQRFPETSRAIRQDPAGRCATRAAERDWLP